MSPQIIDVRHQSRPRFDVRHQDFLIRRLFARDDDTLTHRFVAAEHRFDLPQLDSESADLYLIIVAAKAFQSAVGEPPREIARAI